MYMCNYKQKPDRIRMCAVLTILRLCKATRKDPKDPHNVRWNKSNRETKHRQAPNLM